MELENLLTAKTRVELRSWLETNATNEKACWVIVSMKPAPETILYLDAVEEALCFGWIDGIKKKISDTEVAQRLSPRAKKSSWTELNKERVRRLERLGLMQEAGRKILPSMAIDAFEIDSLILVNLQEDEEVYKNFQAFPELYRRIRLDTIQAYKKSQPELFQKRLAKFIDQTKKNQMYGAWHDNGRLLE